MKDQIEIILEKYQIELSKGLVTSRFIADLEHLIATEVERRIKERLPSLDDYAEQLVLYKVGVLDEIDFYEWIESRLTENNSAELSQIKQINATENKQEGENK